MDSSESGFTTDGMTDSSMSEMTIENSERLDESSDLEESGEEDSEYSLADSYDEEVADVHEYENELQAKAEKEKANFSMSAMMRKKKEKADSSEIAASQVAKGGVVRPRMRPRKSCSAKFDIKELKTGLIEIEEDDNEFETNLQNFDVDKSS